MEDCLESPVLDAVSQLVGVIEASKATTFQELEREITKKVKSFEDEAGTVNSLAVVSGCDILRRFITRLTSAQLEMEFADLRQVLARRASQFLDTYRNARATISRQILPFIRDNSTILVHGYCPTVLHAVCHALRTRTLEVLVTEARPTCAGYRFVSALRRSAGEAARDITVTLIPDTAVAAALPGVDCVLLGADVVTENGGLISTVGSFQVATLAKAMHKPVYVCTETLKLAKTYPLDQSELPPSQGHTFPLVEQASPPEGMTLSDRSVDYTPPSHVTQIYTDLGTMTPAAISDELLKLYT